MIVDLVETLNFRTATLRGSEGARFAADVLTQDEARTHVCTHKPTCLEDTDRNLSTRVKSLDKIDFPWFGEMQSPSSSHSLDQLESVFLFEKFKIVSI